MTLYHDYGFLTEKAEVVKVIATRAGVHVQGRYPPANRDVPALAVREIAPDRLILTTSEGRWRLEIALGTR